MSNTRRFDKKHRVLQKGESERGDGRYEYRWTDYMGKRHFIYARDLDDLRIKEQKIELNKLEGIKDPPMTLTVVIYMYLNHSLSPLLGRRELYK